MKYHYQFVSRNTVRIELIPANKKEAQLIENLSHSDENNLELALLFCKGLVAYSSGAILYQTKFMNFPTVALCGYEPAVQNIETLV